jgi:hypothetical protein
MFFMGPDQDIITGDEFPFFFPRKLESRRAAKNHNPFRMVLVVPEIGRRGLTLGTDPFHPVTIPLKEFRKRLFLQRIRGVGKNI